MYRSKLVLLICQLITHTYRCVGKNLTHKEVEYIASEIKDYYENIDLKCGDD